MKPIKPIESVQDALKLVDSFRADPQDFELAVPDSLLDAIGINMAIITDRVLQRGWEPNGFTQESGYRLYRYKISVSYLDVEQSDPDASGGRECRD